MIELRIIIILLYFCLDFRSVSIKANEETEITATDSSEINDVSFYLMKQRALTNMIVYHSMCIYLMCVYVFV